MRGLWKKDLALIGTNRSMLAAVVLVTVLMILAQNYQFVMFYAALMGGFQILGTITYDTANDGMQYLLTLPVTRSQYTAEKYLFGYGFGLALLLFGYSCGIFIRSCHRKSARSGRDGVYARVCPAAPWIFAGSVFTDSV